MVLLACVASLSLLSACDRTEAVQVRFKLGAGAGSLQRVQFYVSEIELLQGNGAPERFALSAQPPWQSERLALLDLQANQGERRAVVDGTIAKKTFTGIRFSMGVPFDLNHANPLTAVAPLNRADMFWAWQSGYKFLRVELSDEQHAGVFHLGSTGCSSASALRPPAQPCAQPNVVRIELHGIDPLAQIIEVRLQEIAAVLERSTACTGDYQGDAACRAAFAVTGLDPESGACAGANNVCASQRMFAVPSQAVPLQAVP